MNPVRPPTELILVSGLKDGEKAINELLKLSRLHYSTVDKALWLLMKEGIVERRWQGERRKRKYVYRLTVEDEAE